jgi:hypothetical protein
MSVGRDMERCPATTHSKSFAFQTDAMDVAQFLGKYAEQILKKEKSAED